MLSSDRSFARQFFGKTRDHLTVADLNRVIGQRGGPDAIMRKPRGRQILLYALKVPSIWNGLTLQDFIALVPALESAQIEKMDAPYELYRLAALANAISHAITDQAGMFLDEGYRAFQVKGRVLARLIECFGDDIILTEEQDADVTFLGIRLKEPFTQGLHIKRTSLDQLVQQAVS